MRNRSEASGKRRLLPRRPMWAPIFILACCAIPGSGQTPCDEESVVFNGQSYAVRLDSNHVKTYGSSWVVNDQLELWTPYDGAWQQLNGTDITTEAIGSANPGATASSAWTSTLSGTGPGSYTDYSYHWFVPNQSCSSDTSTDYLGYTRSAAVAIQQPAISGANAFWWLGSGVLSDGGYYAQAAWSADPNGATGTPTWSVYYYGSGQVSLSCTNCTSTTATSLAASLGCTADIKITVNYGGFTSNPFWVTIAAPAQLVLVSGYPQDKDGNPNDSTGWTSVYEWNLTDTCGYQDPGLDGYELFGQWTQYNGSNWPSAQPEPPASNSASIWNDEMAKGETYGLNPPARPLQNPLTSIQAESAPWTFTVGSLTVGLGLQVGSNTSMYYVDHGRHK